MTHTIAYCAHCGEPYCTRCTAAAYCTAECERAAASERQRAAQADAVVAHAVAAVAGEDALTQVRRRA